jgi:hypothetical protein
MPADVAVYGGFLGTEGAIDERSPAPLPMTLLDGSMGTPLVPNDDAEHVVVAASGGLLDGLHIVGGNATAASGGTGGGLFGQDVTGLQLNLVTLQGNVAADQGGGIALEGASDMSMSSSVIIGNSAGTVGGGVALRGAASATFDGVTFEANDAVTGGGLYVEGSGTRTVTVSFSHFASNTAAQGGGLYAFQPSVTLMVDNTLFEQNATSTGAGAAVYLASAGGTFDTCRFERNVAGGEGAVYVSASGATFSNCEWTENQSSGDGAGLHLSNASAQIIGGTFTANDALTTGRDGGGAAIFGGAPFLSGVTFVGNQAKLGGGVYTTSSSAAFDTCAFRANVATTGGGALSIQGTSQAPFLTKCLFDLNQVSPGSGGAVDIAGFVSPFLSDSHFSRNTAAAHGGALRVASGAQARVVNSSFDANSAGGFGGAVSSSQGQYFLSLCSLRGNSAASGGALHSSNDTLADTVDNSAAWGNTATFGAPFFDVQGVTTPNVSYSCVQGDWSGTGMVVLDPSLDDPFAVGTGGELFLRHIDLDGVTSACVDAGNDALADESGASWSSLTTRRDFQPDASPVDMGRHH